MEARVRAGIELYGTTLRYAEVEHYGTEQGRRHRLLRLGSCDFDFDVARALWSDDADAASRRIDTLGEALLDVYESTAAEELRVVAHPPRMHSFFAPVSAQTSEAEREARLRREAQLLSGADTFAPAGEMLHVSLRGLHAEGQGEERREWFHVVAVEGSAHAHLQRVVRRLPLPGFAWTSSMEGAAQAATALQRQQPREERAASSGTPFTLAVGRYREHLELALVRRGRFHYAVHVPTSTPADSAYFAAALLERLGTDPSAVGQVFTYGFEASALDAFAALGRITGAAPQALDVCPAVGLDPDRLSRDFEAGPYVPCIGATL